MMRVLMVLGIFPLISVICSGLLFAALAITSAGRYQEDRERDDEDQIRYIEEYKRRRTAKKRSS